LRKTWKNSFKNIRDVEDSVWGSCFVVSPSFQMAQGFQGWKGIENEQRSGLQRQESMKMWPLSRPFWIGTNV